jgi:hypothetical protein
MRLTSTGLGIGTSSPARKLDVFGSIQAADASGIQSVLWSQAVTGAGGVGTNNNFPFAFVTNGTVKAIIDSSGNFGIGTSSPSQRLDVALSSATAYSSGVSGNGLQLYNSSTTNGQYVGITLIGEPTAGNGGIATIMGTTTSSGNMDLTFSTRGSSTLAERMRVTATGDVGIGTSSPGTKLVVSANEPKLRITSTSGSGKSWDISSGGGTTVNAGQFCIYDTTTDAQRFNIISGTGQLLLDGSSNLGLGVTPSAWSGYTAFDIARGSLFGAGSETYLSHNAFWNGSSWRYKATDFATNYRSNNGVHAWSTAPSGTAGNAISFTQAMTLDASGNLGIGTTSPAALLHVNGSNSIARFSGASTSLSAYQTFFNNSAAQAYFGIESSTGTGIIGTGAAYGMVLTTASTNPLVFGTNNTERARITSGGEVLVGLTSATGVAKLQVSGAIRTTGFTVATLPAGTVGMKTYVTDALAPSFGVAVAGSGAVTIPVFYDGANWIVA